MTIIVKHKKTGQEVDYDIDEDGVYEVIGGGLYTKEEFDEEFEIVNQNYAKNPETMQEEDKTMQNWEEDIQDEFMSFWDSKKETLGLGNYSDDVTFWWINKIQKERERIIKNIQQVKEAVRTQTGSFKYDDQYDDCIEIVKNNI